MTMGRYKIIAALIVVGGLLLTGYALLSATSDVHSSMMGIQVTSRSYSLAQMLLGIVGSFLAASGTAFILFKEDYEPLPQNAPASSINSQPSNRTQSSTAQEAPGPIANEASPIAAEVGQVDEKRLVLRLLTGDERAMFRAIVDSGGEALQKDLIIKTKMSDAKVSRVLDRLVEKGIVSKTRHGVTNKVRIEIEP